jgi:hypothetical protein
MNWSACPRIVLSNTFAVRGSAGLARIELSESNLNPAASTSRRTVEDSIRCRRRTQFSKSTHVAKLGTRSTVWDTSADGGTSISPLAM